MFTIPPFSYSISILMGIFLGYGLVVYFCVWGYFLFRIFLWRMLFIFIAYMEFRGSHMQGNYANRPNNHNYLDKDNTLRFFFCQKKLFKVLSTCVFISYIFFVGPFLTYVRLTHTLIFSTYLCVALSE